MRKKGKILSIVLSVMMLMQVFAITSFAAETPGNVHWATENDEFKSSDADLVFELVDGIELYKITLYKNGEILNKLNSFLIKHEEYYMRKSSMTKFGGTIYGDLFKLQAIVYDYYFVYLLYKDEFVEYLIIFYLYIR